MKCPFCGAMDTQVIDSRVNDEGDSIRRRRKCGECDKRFTTYETAELHMPQVVKTNGTREEFSREKLRLSFSRALHKRPVPTDYVERALDSISQKLLSLGEREIPARELGESVMHELKLMDKVAYIRFASVYRSFSDVDDFNNAIRDLDKRDIDKRDLDIRDLDIRDLDKHEAGESVNPEPHKKRITDK